MTLAGRPWAGIELVSESRVEEIVLHIARWAASQRKGQAFQLLFPVKSRDIDGIKLLTPYLWARMLDLRALEGVVAVQGATLVRDAKHPIPIEDKFVQGVMERARVAAEGWSEGIKKGSFVRVLLGNERMLCGNIESVEKGIAVVEIKLMTRTVRLTVGVRVLLDLSYVSKRKRRYFYQGEDE